MDQVIGKGQSSFEVKSWEIIHGSENNKEAALKILYFLSNDFQWVELRLNIFYLENAVLVDVGLLQQA
mgnify:CR=1 FL=1